MQSKTNSFFALTGFFGRPSYSYANYYLYRSKGNDENYESVFERNNLFSITESLNSIGCLKSGILLLSSNIGLYRSLDDGDSWQKVDSLKEHTNFTNFVSNSANHVYATKGKALFKSTDNGSTWQFIDSTFQITKLAIDSKDNLYIGTANDGLFKSTFNATGPVNELPLNFSLSQNYPNPFNPETTINYQLPTPGLVTLTVYDLLGREVATLVDEYKQAGNYNCKLRIENGELSSGIYFYRLQSGSFSETK
ncbi:MAG: hypothetical protein C0412_17350, partial [Flavobacterium sp.]|nr:hypothetical protein [Flavobacterium sp.]